MIHSGQEFARSKVVPNDIKVDDRHKGMIDHNTYDKDNGANYINYNHAELNADLLNYYQGLIKLRKTHEAFRRAEYSDIKFHELIENKFALAYTLKYGSDKYFVMFNAHQKLNSTFELPSGEWKVLVNGNSAGSDNNEIVSGKYKVPKISGAVLKKIN